MDKPMTIEEFNALLLSEEDDSPLLAALRKLTTIEKPEEIIELADDEAPAWESWTGLN